MPSFAIAVATALLSQQAIASTRNPDLMATPPMGFNNWARFQCELNETLFTETADAMLEKGLLDAGYNWINLDDCWPLHDRDENGSLQADPKLFPNGLKWLGDYVKERGFRYGIYSDAGNLTCGGYPGSLDYEEIDARDFHDWGFEYLKLDGCNMWEGPGQTLEDRYQEIYKRWHDIFAVSDNPLIYSESAPAYFAMDTGKDNLTDWYSIANWVPEYGELARHSADIANFETTEDPWPSIMFNYGQHVRLARTQKRGYINDPDYLISDETYLTLVEKKSQFAMWCALGSPLILSAYIPAMEGEMLEFLKHNGLIEIDQDDLALQATLVSRDINWDVLSRTLANNDRLLAVLNNGTEDGELDVSPTMLGWTKEQGCELAVKDVISGEETTVDACSKESISVKQPSHGTAVYRITADHKDIDWTPTGMIFNARSLKCLTVTGDELAFAECDASPGQLWNMGKYGDKISPASDPQSCLSADNHDAFMAPCSQADGVDSRYDVSGNIKNQIDNKCLTEGADGSTASWEACGYLTNQQVFEAPSGWQL